MMLYCPGYVLKKFRRYSRWVEGQCGINWRSLIYTTNAIESVNSVIHKAIKNRRLFPNDDSAMKVIYLAIQSASKKWTMPIRNWKAAMNRFIIEFEEQLAPYI